MRGAHVRNETLETLPRETAGLFQRDRGDTGFGDAPLSNALTIRIGFYQRPFGIKDAPAAHGRSRMISGTMPVLAIAEAAS